MNNRERRTCPMKFKKFMAALCASVMVLGATMTVVANPSSGTGIKIEVVGGGTVDVKNEISAEAEGKLTSAVSAVAGTSYDATTLGVFDVEIVSGTSKTVAFNIVGVKATDTIKVLHWNGTGWNVVSKVEVKDGKVTATFDSLSPVAIVKLDKKAATPDNSGNNGSGNNGSTTPKPDKEPPTGVGVSAAALAAAAGLAGVVVCKKKSN